RKDTPPSSFNLEDQLFSHDASIAIQAGPRQPQSKPSCGIISALKVSSSNFAIFMERHLERYQ
ncbi:MAG: hypothetical protein ACKO0N_15010, partial [Planctomycetota bacterium]